MSAKDPNPTPNPTPNPNPNPTPMSTPMSTTERPVKGSCLLSVQEVHSQLGG